MERDTLIHGLQVFTIQFQLTRSRGAWQSKFYDSKVTYDFNSHAHVERDDETVDRVLEFYDFNSHAHVERDDLGECTFFTKFISTHTLTWSVTTLFCFLRHKMTISTHTLTWSVTLKVQKPLFYNVFQLTRSRGAWRR